MIDRKIIFFDIDGTLTSEIDASIPESTKKAIKLSRQNGNLMFINTGRCMQNVEERFRNIGFDGYVCGCGTNIYCYEHESLSELLYIEQPHNIVKEILTHARKFHLDILFESRREVRFDTIHPFYTDGAKKQYNLFIKRNYDMSHCPDSDDFTCDKFVVWFEDINDIPHFCNVADKYFDCINRGGNFREFVPHGYSKATGIQYLLNYFNIPNDNAFAIGDSNNDLSMLSYVKNSIAMGNSQPKDLLSQVTYVTKNASDNGIYEALKHFHFF